MLKFNTKNKNYTTDFRLCFNICSDACIKLLELKPLLEFETFICRCINLPLKP